MAVVAAGLVVVVAAGSVGATRVSLSQAGSKGNDGDDDGFHEGLQRLVDRPSFGLLVLILGGPEEATQ